MTDWLLFCKFAPHGYRRKFADFCPVDSELTNIARASLSALVEGKDTAEAEKTIESGVDGLLAIQGETRQQLIEVLLENPEALPGVRDALAAASLAALKQKGPAEASMDGLRAALVQIVRTELITEVRRRIGAIHGEVSAGVSTLTAGISPAATREPLSREALLDTPITREIFSTRTFNTLTQNAKIAKISELCTKSPHELVSTKNMGNTGMGEICFYLYRHGLSLRIDSAKDAADFNEYIYKHLNKIGADMLTGGSGSAPEFNELRTACPEWKPSFNGFDSSVGGPGFEFKGFNLADATFGNLVGVRFVECNTRGVAIKEVHGYCNVRFIRCDFGGAGPGGNLQDKKGMSFEDCTGMTQEKS